MPPKYNNAAGRLNELFERLLSMSSNSKSQCFQVWEGVLGCPEDKSLSHVQRMLRVSKLLAELSDSVKDIEESIRENLSEDDQQLFLKHLHKIPEVLSPTHLAGNMDFLRAILSEPLIDHLWHCARSLPTEQTLEGDALNELDRAIHEIFLDVKASNIHPRLRRYILQLLSKIKAGIDHYHVFGVQGLQNALTLLVGSMDVNSTVLKETKTKPEEKSLFDKMFGIVEKLNNLISLANNVGPVLEHSKEAILLLGTHITQNLPSL